MLLEATVIVLLLILLYTYYQETTGAQSNYTSIRPIPNTNATPKPLPKTIVPPEDLAPSWEPPSVQTKKTLFGSLIPGLPRLVRSNTPRNPAMMDYSGPTRISHMTAPISSFDRPAQQRENEIVNFPIPKSKRY